MKISISVSIDELSKKRVPRQAIPVKIPELPGIKLVAHRHLMPVRGQRWLIAEPISGCGIPGSLAHTLKEAIAGCRANCQSRIAKVGRQNIRGEVFKAIRARIHEERSMRRNLRTVED